jgi:hypothetical protein
MLERNYPATAQDQDGRCLTAEAIKGDTAAISEVDRPLTEFRLDQSAHVRDGETLRKVMRRENRAAEV